MNRQLLFRGISKETNKYVFGHYYNIQNIEHYILEPCVLGVVHTEVIPESVGQFTSRLDNSGGKIFEHDKVIYLGAKGFVFYSDEYSMFMVKFEIGSEYSFDSISSLIKVIK